MPKIFSPKRLVPKSLKLVKILLTNIRRMSTAILHFKKAYLPLFAYVLEVNMRILMILTITSPQLRFLMQSICWQKLNLPRAL